MLPPLAVPGMSHPTGRLLSLLPEGCYVNSSCVLYGHVLLVGLHKTAPAHFMDANCTQVPAFGTYIWSFASSSSMFCRQKMLVCTKPAGVALKPVWQFTLYAWKRCALPENVYLGSAQVIKLIQSIVYVFGIGVLGRFWVLDTTLLLLFSVSL